MRTGLMNVMMDRNRIAVMNRSQYNECNDYRNHNIHTRTNHSCKRHIRSQHIVNKETAVKYMILTFAIVMLFCISSFVIVHASERLDKKSMTKYYTSITIESDDTLWDIAQQYNTGNENTVKYINTVKKMNHMSSDTLYSGNNLLIYYYDYAD